MARPRRLSVAARNRNIEIIREVASQITDPSRQELADIL